MFDFAKYRFFFKFSSWIFLVLSCFLFKVNNDLHFMICEVLFIIYVFTVLRILSSSFFKFIYEPPVFLLIFGLIYDVLKFPYYFGFQTPEYFIDFALLRSSIYKVDDYYGTSIQILIFQSLCIVVLLIAYSLVDNTKSTKVLPKTSDLTIVSDKYVLFVLTICIILSFLGLAYVTNGNFSLLLTRRSGNVQAYEILKDNYLLSLISSFNLLLVPLYLVLRLENGKSWKYVFLLYIPTAIQSFLVTGARGFIIYSLITSLLFIYIFGKVALSRVIFVFPLFFLFFSVLGLVRRASDTTSSSLSENMQNTAAANQNWYLELTSYQLQLRDEMVFSNVNSTNLLYGASYGNIATFAIPRSILGDLKPLFLDGYVARIFWGRDDIGLPLNSFIESFFNFSFLGFLIFVPIGIFMRKITQYMKVRGGNIQRCVIIIFFVYAQTFTSSQLVYLLQYLTILYVLKMIYNISFIKKSFR